MTDIPAYHALIFRDDPRPIVDINLDLGWTLAGLMLSPYIEAQTDHGQTWLRTQPEGVYQLGGKLYTGSLMLEESVPDRPGLLMQGRTWLNAVTWHEWEINHQLVVERDVLISAGVNLTFVNWAYHTMMSAYWPKKVTWPKRLNARAWLQIAQLSSDRKGHFDLPSPLLPAARNVWGAGSWTELIQAARAMFAAVTQTKNGGIC